MATLRDIKNRISGVSSIERITSAMKMVSFVKSKKVQKQAEEARPYNKKIAEMLKLLTISDKSTIEEHHFFKPKNDIVKNVVIIVIASDKGMCGSFNSNLFKRVDTYLQTGFKARYPEAALQLITVGTKPTDYYKKRNYNIVGSFPNAFQSIDYSLVDKIHSLFIDKFITGSFDRVQIFYSKFINVMKQEPTLFKLLPIELNVELEATDNNIDYIFEPDKNEIFETLINQYLGVNVWTPILESSAAEQSARLLAMDKATQNAQDLIKDLRLQYNNARQAAITTEMLEIVGGAEALRK
jgi:F-type H+-transporting ATPase subunit gamma